MLALIDTSVAILLRDKNLAVINKVDALNADLCLSIVTRVELEGGVHRNPTHTLVRRQRLDEMLAVIPTLPFDGDAAEEYGKIVAAAGYSRRKILDRMIAAQALVHRATLVTLNRDDFSDVPGLHLLSW